MSINESVVVSADELSELCGEGYFNVLMKKLSQLIDADYTFVARILDSSTAETVSLWGNGTLHPAIKYHLKGTPCEDLRCSGESCILYNVAEQYPADQFLKDLSVEGYIGITLSDERGEVIGILSALFCKPIPRDQVESITRYFMSFANRASRELERIKYERMLKNEIQGLQATNDRLQIAQQVYDYSKDGIIVTNADNEIVYVNASLEAMSGYTLSELEGQDPRVLSSGQQDRLFYKGLWNDLAYKGYWQGEFWNRNKEGELYPVFTCISRIPDEHGRVKSYVAIHRDITSEKEAQALIAYQATHDALTGMLNRYEFNGQLDRELFKVRVRKNQGAFITLDVDDFKSINDTQGHSIGDVLLQMIAKRIKDCVREGDIIARLGGDEFAIFTEFTDMHIVEQLISDLLDAFRPAFEFEALRLRCNTSIGVSIFPQDAVDSHELFKCSDQALYEAKNSGGATYAFFTPELRVAAERHQEVRLRLADAIEQGLIEVKYQPIVNLVSGRMVRVEALARWTDEVLGPVRPDEFIEIAEHSGLIQLLGCQIAEIAINDLARINTHLNQPIGVSINRSPQEFVELADEYDVLPDLAKQAGVSPDLISIELTESLMMKDPVLAQRQLSQLKEAGFKLSLDDFGTGYSSLAYLKNFPFDVLKVDRSFVNDITEDEGDYVLVKTILEMAKNLGMHSVAEGVETEGQLALVEQLGCECVQGYFYSPAVSVEELLEYIAEYFPSQLR
ncbi:EAL domain-containing protein [Pontibacterium granulatum]|uniref:putative bifunctional diguanylate cyclase/phosphodiesterase n=1 Tax=Pontibacterium granulatum TaxID=2036029 RepID=UPI002499E435|nr:EAL domain-containing protein [Pontibacterium granulatum]MDI3325799.1 EAL domain-containing protein [Pontibacterium granulatum]